MLIVSSISVVHKLILTTLVLTSTLRQGPNIFFIATFSLSHPRGDDKDSTDMYENYYFSSTSLNSLFVIQHFMISKITYYCITLKSHVICLVNIECPGYRF